MKTASTVAAAALLLSACATEQQTSASTPSSPPATAPATATSVQSEAGSIAVEQLAKLDRPWGLAWLPDGGLLITERAGRLRIFAGGTLSEPLAGVPAVFVDQQGGLADVAVDPDFASNRFVYLSYTEPAPEQPADAKETPEPRFGGFINLQDVAVRGLAVARARLETDGLHDLRVIWRQVPKMVGRGHYSGRLVFGPDETLYITSGDRMRFDPAQDRSSNAGKIVRINRDGSIPPDNPFANSPGTRQDIWTLGHRNVLGIAFEPGTGRLWANEMGPKGGDEFNLISKGVDYGWPAVSEGVNYNDAAIPKHSTRPEFTPPVRSWTPVISPSGLLFYSGDMFKGWRGNAIIGGLSSQALIRLSLNGPQVSGAEVISMGKRIRDVIEARDGSLLVLTDGENGELLRLTPAQ